MDFTKLERDKTLDWYYIYDCSFQAALSSNFSRAIGKLVVGHIEAVCRRAYKVSQRRVELDLRFFLGLYVILIFVKNIRLPNDYFFICRCVSDNAKQSKVIDSFCFFSSTFTVVCK